MILLFLLTLNIFGTSPDDYPEMTISCNDDQRQFLYNLCDYAHSTDFDSLKIQLQSNAGLSFDLFSKCAENLLDLMETKKLELANAQEVRSYLQDWLKESSAVRGVCGLSNFFSSCPPVVCPCPCPVSNPCVPNCYNIEAVATTALGVPITTGSKFFVRLISANTYQVLFSNPLCSIAIPVVTDSNGNFLSIVGSPTNSSFTVTGVVPGDTFYFIISQAT